MQVSANEKINFKRYEKNITLSNLSIYTKMKTYIIQTSKISAPKWIYEFELPNGSFAQSRSLKT